MDHRQNDGVREERLLEILTVTPRSTTRTDSGLSGSWKETFSRLLLGSGIEYISKDKDDLPVFSLPTDENAISKILHVYDLFSDEQRSAATPER